MRAKIAPQLQGIAPGMVLVEHLWPTISQYHQDSGEGKMANIAKFWAECWHSVVRQYSESVVCMVCRCWEWKLLADAMGNTLHVPRNNKVWQDDNIHDAIQELLDCDIHVGVGIVPRLVAKTLENKWPVVQFAAYTLESTVEILSYVNYVRQMQRKLELDGSESNHDEVSVDFLVRLATEQNMWLHLT